MIFRVGDKTALKRYLIKIYDIYSHRWKTAKDLLLMMQNNSSNSSMSEWDLETKGLSSIEKNWLLRDNGKTLIWKWKSPPIKEKENLPRKAILCYFYFVMFFIISRMAIFVISFIYTKLRNLIFLIKKKRNAPLHVTKCLMLVVEVPLSLF